MGIGRSKMDWDWDMVFGKCMKMVACQYHLLIFFIIVYLDSSRRQSL